MPTDHGDVERGPRRPIGPAARLLLGIVAAFLIYRPDRELPFHHLDFSEFLPILQSSDSFGERTRRLLEFYGRFGRANVLPYALLSVKWEVFGPWSPGWQWSRFAVMVGILILTYRLLRRLGAGELGAMAASGLFLVAPAATAGWIQLTMAEPLGTLLILTLCLTILHPRWPRGNHWYWPVALLTMGILLSKEMLLPTLMLPLGLGFLMNEEGRLGTPAITRRVSRQLVVYLLVGSVCVGWVVLTMLSVSESAYYLTYGQSLRPALETTSIWLTAFSPIDPIRGLPHPAGTLAVLLVVALVGGGCFLFVSSQRPRAPHVWLIALAIAFPLVGAVAYMPWPAYLPFYAIPYLVGGAIPIALALTGIQRRASTAISMIAYVVWFGLLAFAGVGAHWQAESTAALQRLNHRLVMRVAAEQTIDTVLFATARIDSLAWRGPAGTLSRYADAIGVRWPPARDIPCPVSEPDVGQIVVYRDGLCPSPPDVDPLVERFQRLSLRRLTMVPDSIQVGLRVGLRDR